MGYSEKLDEIFEAVGDRYGDTNLFVQRGRSKEDYAKEKQEFEHIQQGLDNATRQEDIDGWLQELDDFHRKTKGKYK